MDPQEIKDKLMAAINGIIKDEPDQANANLHDVLAAKMRDRINPPAPELPEIDLDLDIEEDPKDSPTGEE